MVMAEPAARPSIPLAELLAVLSLATDLGMGQLMEHVLRQCLISLRLAQRLGLDEADRVVVYYAALIAWVAVTWMPTSKRSGSATTCRSRLTSGASISRRPPLGRCSCWVISALAGRWQNGHDSALPFLAVADGRLRRCWEITGWQLMHWQRG
jgi:hypothetical protein